jgi:hypothetical protein
MTYDFIQPSHGGIISGPSWSYYMLAHVESCPTQLTALESSFGAFSVRVTVSEATLKRFEVFLVCPAQLYIQ